MPCTHGRYCELVKIGQCNLHRPCRFGIKCSRLTKRRCTFYHPPAHFNDRAFIFHQKAASSNKKNESESEDFDSDNSSSNEPIISVESVKWTGQHELNSDIKQNNNTGTQIIKQTQPIIQPPATQPSQPPKPQTIQLQAPKLQSLRCTVPTIPTHLRQQQENKTNTRSINSNTMKNNNRKRLNRDYNNASNSALSPPIPKRRKIDNIPVNIRFEDRKTKASITMQINPQTKFATVRKKVAKEIEKTMKPPNKRLTHLQLYFNRKALSHKQCINDCDYIIVNNATVHFACVWKHKNNGVLTSINIKEFGGSNSTLMTIDPSWKIKVFRKHLMENKKLKLYWKNAYGITDAILKDRFGLLFNGVLLSSKKKIHECGICERDTVVWYLKQVHTIKVTVKVLDIVYSKIFCFKVSDGVNCIKAAIKNQNRNRAFNVNSKNISLWWKGCELQNKTVIEYGVCDGDVIVCCLKNKIENKMRAKDMSMEKGVKCQVKRINNVDLVGDNTNNGIPNCEGENDDSDIEIIDYKTFQKNIKQS